MLFRSIDAVAWKTLEAPVDDLIAYVGIQTWWHTRRHWYSEPYQARIEEKIARRATPRLYDERATS